MHKPRFVAQHFARDTHGGVAIIFGLSLIVLMCCGALAIDTSRIYNLQSKVQAALDAASLAGAKALDPDNFDESAIRQVAEAFFNTQTSAFRVEGIELSNFRAEPDLTTRTVSAQVDVRIKSYFGKVAGLADEVNFTPSSSTKHTSRKVEVALVVDITGSMCDTPPGLADPPCTTGAKIDALKAAAKEMVDAFYANSPQAGSVRMSLVPYAASVNVGPFFSDTAVTGGAVDTCVLEREGTNQYTNAVPAPGSLFETTGNTTVPFYYNCPTEEITPLTDLTTTAARDAFKAKIDALAAKWGTAGHIGLAWGWYTLSPEWNPIWPAESDPKPYRDDVTKVVVLMTDGMFNSSYWVNGISLTGADRTNPAVTDSSPYQALQLCEAIKDRVAQPYGPTIYTVSFMAPPAADALMQNCSGAGNAYTADNRSALIAAFNDIVHRLTSLAVTN